MPTTDLSTHRDYPVASVLAAVFVIGCCAVTVLPVGVLGAWLSRPRVIAVAAVLALTAAAILLRRHGRRGSGASDMDQSA